MSLEKLFTVKEVADHLTVSKCQVHRLTKAGKLKATRLSERRIVYTKQSIMDFLDACNNEVSV